MSPPFILLVLELALAPWLNCGADLATRPILYGVVTLALLWAVFRRSQRGYEVPIAVYVLIAAMVWVGFSLIPFDQNLNSTTPPLRESLTGSSWGPLSLNPSETRIQLSLLCSMSAVFFLATQVPLNEFRRRGIALVMLVNGALISLFGVVQKYSWNDRLYWHFDLPKNHTTFGPMVYHNVAGACLVMCLAGGAYLFVDVVRNYRRISDLNAKRMSIFLLFTTVLVGLVCTLSRGAILSFMVAGSALMYLQFRRSIARRDLVWVLPLAVVTIALLLWFGMSDDVATRLVTVTNGEMLNDERLNHWFGEAAEAARDYWMVGCGAGVYADLVAIYESRDTQGFLFKNAHNQYLETLIVAGVPGCLLLIATIACVIRSCLLRAKGAASSSRVFACVGLFVVISQSMHAIVDYCLSVPGIAITAAALVGFAIGQVDDGAHQPHGSATTPWRRRVSASLVWVFLACMAWSTYDAITAARLDIVMKRLPWRETQSDLQLPTVDTSLAQLQDALTHRPDSATGQEALAIFQTIRYRLLARSRLSSETGFSESDHQLWQWTAPVTLHHRVHTLHRRGDEATIEEIRDDPQIRENLYLARDALLASRAACPLLPGVHLRIEELGFLNSSAEWESEVNAERVRLTAGNDFAVLFECGKREFGAGRYDSAFRCWRQSLELSSFHIDEIIYLGSQHLSTRDFLERVVPPSARLIVAIFDNERKRNEQSRLDLAVVAKRGQELVRLPPKSGSAHEFQLRSRIAVMNDDLELGVEELEKAVRMKPEAVEWRFNLAKLYSELGRVAEAERHGVICVRLHNTKKHRDFLEDLRSR